MTITAEQVADYLALPTVDHHLPGIVAAVNAMVTEWHGPDWPAGVEHGAIMLAARLHRRRATPNGVESFSDMGATYVSRWDSDLDRHLRINGWTPPRVG